MQPGNIAHQVIEAVSSHPSGRVQIDSVKSFHDLCVIRNLEIRNYRFPILLNLYIFTVILSDGHRGVDDIRDNHHILFQLLLYFLLPLCQLFHPASLGSYLLLNLFCFHSFSLGHQGTDLLGDFISLRTKSLYLLLDASVLRIQRQNLIYQRKLLILELISDVLFYNLRIFTNKFNI